MFAWRPGRFTVLRISIAMTMILSVTLGMLPTRAAAAAPAQTITRFSTSDQVIVLTFDAEGARSYADEIINTLAEKGVRASFGVTGPWVASNPDLVQRLVHDGHHLMSHSWSHPSFTQISSGQRVHELRQTEDVVRAQTGIELQPYFRPPYGDYDHSVLIDLGSTGYAYNVLWSIDPQGWRGYSGATITDHVLRHAAPGAIVLMHTTAAGDAAALPGLIDQLRARGYTFATVADFLSGPPAPVARTFPETGFTVSGGFLRYWDRFGGLARFGYPISEELQEEGMTVQYFERARFEWQPGTWPERFDVHLTRLGSNLTAGRTEESPFQPTGPSTTPGCVFVKQTEHNLCAGFRSFWEAHGGLAIYGYPISEEFVENGRTVQYFERARFEWHPGVWPERFDVLLGRLGAETLG